MAGPLPQGPETIRLPHPRQDHSFAPTTAAIPTSSVNLPSIANATAGLSTSPTTERLKLTGSMASGSAGTARPFDAEERRDPTPNSHLQTAQAALGAIMDVTSEHQPKQSDADHHQHGESGRHESSRDADGHRRSRSPATMTDAYGNGETSQGIATLMNSAPVASPGPMDDNNQDEEMVDEGNKSFSYPVPMGAASLNDPRRGMSLPHTGYNKGSSRSPNSKKHRCPFCSTEFTRHHNLKSHLLTHSQEKPYVCQTCQSRFRRLHDLKRHTKLHTGERPHICPKCGRRFARGDALARHNRGTGGCAGRRSSMGSFAGGHDGEFDDRDGGDDDAMEGLIYTEPERIDEEDERKLTLPSIRRQGSPSDNHHSSAGRHVSFQSHSHSHSHTSSTYPPLGINRPSTQGGLFPPVSSHGGSSSSTSPISPSANFSFSHSGASGSSATYTSAQHGASPSIFSQSAMMESPKPLSPNAMSSRQLGHGPEAHQRQPSISQPTVHSPTLKAGHPSQQSHFGRGSGGSVSSIGIPPTLNLPSPQAPQLPPPQTLTIPESRFILHTPQNTHTRSPLISPALSPGRPDTHHSHHHSHSRSNTDISTMYDSNAKNDSSTSATNNGNNNSNMYSHASPQRQLSNPNVGLGAGVNSDRLWAHIKTLEDRMGGLESEVVRLRDQLATAQGQAGQHGSAAPNGP